MEVFMNEQNVEEAKIKKMIDDLDFLSSYDNILILDSILELEDIMI